jgi:hypothetical protein
MREITIHEDLAYVRGLTTPEFLSSLDSYDRVNVRYPSSQVLLNLLGVPNVRVVPPTLPDVKVGKITKLAVLGEYSDELARRALREYGVLLEDFEFEQYLNTYEGEITRAIYVSCSGYHREQPVSTIETCLKSGYLPFTSCGIVNYYPGLVKIGSFEDFLATYSL